MIDAVIVECPVQLPAMGAVNGIACHRGRRPSFSMPLGRTPTGRIVDWKPPGKEAPHKSAGSDSPAQQGSKDAQKAEQIPHSGKHPRMVYAKWVLLLHGE